MIVNCTKESLEKLINQARNKNLAYVKILKDDKDFIMDYELYSRIEESLPDRIKRITNNNINSTLDIIDKLEYLKLLLKNNVMIHRYELHYDCITPGSKPLKTYTCAIPKDTELVDFDEPETKNGKETKITDIDWDELFKDKLDQAINGLFVKKSAKKYTFATYKDIIDIFKKL